MSNNSNPDRPWYSFRWKILLWIALPFYLITLSDLLAVLVTAIGMR